MIVTWALPLPPATSTARKREDVRPEVARVGRVGEAAAGRQHEHAVRRAADDLVAQRRVVGIGADERPAVLPVRGHGERDR